MSGLAQKDFLENGGKTSSIFTEIKASSSEWHTLESAHSAGFLPYFDLAYAKYSTAEEPLAALLCHLTLATKSGHLCIKLDDASPLPSVEELWRSSDDKPLPNSLLLGIKALISEGWNSFTSETSSSSPFVLANQRLYLRRFWETEQAIIKQLNRIESHPPKYALAIDSKKIHSLQLQPEQISAINQIASHSLVLITGGPGTGKTFTAGVAIQMIWESLHDDDKKTFRIALAAPTGKAAANLEASINRAFSDKKDSPFIQSKTLHSLLKIHPDSPLNSYSPLPYDLILVDEGSMIDAQMMMALLSSIKKGARLVFLGDSDQLPPVEAGNLFHDMICSQTLNLPSTHLHTCLRIESKEILTLAQKINQGNSDAVLKLISDLDYRMLTKPYEQRIDLIETILASPLNGDSLRAASKLKDLLQQERILTSMREGFWGVNTLNKLIHHEAVLRGHRIFPIMITRNYPKLELFNGEVGFLTTENKAYFLSPTGEIRELSSTLLPAYEWAYALSIHKSQGSEFNHVHVLLPQGSDVFGRELLYTAVTRAKKSLTLWSDEATLRKVVNNRSLRVSGGLES